MKVAYPILVALLFASGAGVGCTTKNTVGIPLKSTNTVISHALYVEEFVLTQDHPYSEKHEVTFLGISDAGIASLKLKSGEIVTAKRGDSFPCEQFGRVGLVYVSSFPNNRGIHLERYGCESSVQEVNSK